MEARYATRQNQLLQACQVAPEIFQEVMPRLHTCMEPCVEPLHSQALTQQARTDVSGLLSDVQRTHVESIASRFGQDRLPLQRCIGWAPWDEEPLRQELRGQVAKHLGQPEGVRVFDPSAFPKSGIASVGVARQWCGPVGNVSAKGHTLVDLQRSLPKAWTQEKVRLDKAGVPTARRGYRTRHQVALAMLEQDGASLPHGWMAGDDERGRPSWFRRRLAALGER